MSGLDCPFTVPMVTSAAVTSLSVIAVTCVASLNFNCSATARDEATTALSALFTSRHQKQIGDLTSLFRDATSLLFSDPTSLFSDPTSLFSDPTSLFREARDDCTNAAVFNSVATGVGLLSATTFVLSAIAAAVRCVPTGLPPPPPPPPPTPPPPPSVTNPTPPQQPSTQPPQQPSTQPPPPPPPATSLAAFLDIFSIIGVVTLPVNPCASPDSAPVLGGGGQCAPVLTGANCQAGFWSIVQPDTFMSVCAPRLCDPGRVYQPSDGLCHDVREPGICPDGLWPYVTAFGTVLCDCDEAQYRDASGRCADLFSRDSCPAGQSLHPFRGDSETLQCSADACSAVPAVVSPAGDQPAFADVGGQCFEFGTQGPCAAGQLLGYDIQLREPVCVIEEEPFFDQQSADVLPLAGQQSALTARRRRRRAAADGLRIGGLRVSRQSPLRIGVVRSPLLVRCGSAARTSATFACRSVIFPGRNRQRRGTFLPPVPPNFVCPQTEATLSGDGRCLTAAQAAASSCHPGTQLDPSGRCRPVSGALGRR